MVKTLVNSITDAVKGGLAGAVMGGWGGVMVCNMADSNYLYWTAIPGALFGVAGAFYGYYHEINCAHCHSYKDCKNCGPDNHPKVKCKNYTNKNDENK